MPSTDTPTRRRGGRRAPAPTPEPVATPDWLTSLSGAVSTAILGKFPLADLIAGADKVRQDVDGENQAWLRTAKDLAIWRDKFLAADLSQADHFEPVAAAWLRKGVGTVRSYLTGRRVALDLGISNMSKEVLQSVSMYDLDTARAILDESGGDIGKTREIKARLKAEAEAEDPEAAAKAALAKSNRIKGFGKTFDSEVREDLGAYVLSGEPVSTAVLIEVYLLGREHGGMRMAPKTGLVRNTEMVAGARLVTDELQREYAAKAEARTEDLSQ